MLKDFSGGSKQFGSKLLITAYSAQGDDLPDVPRMALFWGLSRSPPVWVRRVVEVERMIALGDECPEGDYIVYWQGQRGKIMKGGLRPIKW